MSVAVAISAINGADPGAGLDDTRNSLIVEGTLTLTGNYGTAASHGDVINFGVSGFPATSYPPKAVEIEEYIVAGVAPTGFRYIYAFGTTLENGQLIILAEGSGAGATTGQPELTENELYASCTPSLQGQVLRFKAWLIKNL